MGLVAFLPLGEIASADILYNFGVKGVVKSSGEMIYNGMPLIILTIIILAINVFVIFKFKNRSLQIRFSIINMVLMVGFMLVSWYFISASLKQIGAGVYSFQLAMAFPIVAAILNYLAFRAIAKDEALVKSIDRIR